MLSGVVRTVEEEPLYDSPVSHSSGDKMSRGHRAALFVCQVITLLWKEWLDHARRPCRVLSELLLPAFMVLILVYAVSLSPVSTIDSFRYTSVPHMKIDSPIPNESSILPIWKDNVVASTKWYDVFKELKLNYFLTGYAWTLAKLRNVTLLHEDSPDVKSWSSMWTVEEVSDTLLSNRYAASPFKVPTFDEYTKMIFDTQVTLGRGGMKHTMKNDPFLRFIFNFGHLAFALGYVEGAAREELSTMTELLIEYLNATTKSFSSVVMCRSNYVNKPTNTCAFETVREVNILEKTSKRSDALWAIIRVDRLSKNDKTFRYTLLVNKLFLQQWRSMETFPQGLGKDYATYAYSGILTLQYELNTYFAALLGKSPHGDELQAGNLTLTPLLDSICDFTPTPHNATKGLFLQPSEGKQIAMVNAALAENDTTIVTIRPYFALESIYVPCLYEVESFCFNTKDATSLTACLANVSETNMSAMCRGAQLFIQKCLPSTKCSNTSAFDLLTKIPSDLRRCSDSLSGICETKDYINAVTQNSIAANCAKELEDVCLSSWMSNSVYFTCRNDYFAKKAKSHVCQAVLDSFYPCSDEYETICPTKGFKDQNSIPYSCLYANSHILSDSCRATHLIKDILPNMFTRQVIRQNVDAATYYCREVHDIQKTLSASIVAQAFPAKKYEQEMFFLSGGSFVGLLLASAYYFPFASTVRSIARERESWQYMYMIVIGTHPLAILFSKFLTSFLKSIIISLFVTLAMMCSVDIPSSVIYGLLYMYSLSLSSFSTVIGALVPTEQVATIISPFILFLSITPAFGIDKTTDISGFSSILPPTVLAKAVHQYSRGLQTNFIMAAVGPFTPRKALWILFGLFLLYGVIAVFLEYLLLPNSGLHRSFRKAAKKLKSTGRRLFRRPARRVTAFFEGEEMRAENVRVYSASVTPSNTDVNIGGVSFSREGAEKRKRDAGVGILATEELRSGVEAQREQLQSQGSYQQNNGNDSLAALLSPRGVSDSVANSGGLPKAQERTPAACPRVPRNWQPAVIMRDVEYDIPGRRDGLRVSQANFYRDQLNCLMGRATAGKSLLLQLLMGWSDRPRGSICVEGRDIWVKGRSKHGVGICLQQTVLWERMTVEENIRLVQLLTGRLADSVELDGEISTLTSALQLMDAKQELVGRLTPGLARKVAVAMAFAGGARTILLDDPTAHTDLSSGKEIWRLISQNTRQRCVIVATNDVEMIDHFADYAIVLHHGRVTMSGTPSYIKWRLCGGWVVTVCRSWNTRTMSIIDRVIAAAPEVILVSNVGNELAFRIPENVASSSLPNLLDELERAKKSKMITSITVSDAHLGEAFVRLARALELRDPHQPDGDDSEAESDAEDQANLHGTQYSLMPSTTTEFGRNNNNNNNNNNGMNNNVNSVGASSLSRTAEDTLVSNVGSAEERGCRQTSCASVFIRNCGGIFQYRLLEAVMSPFVTFLFITMPFLLIVVATSFLGTNIISELFSEISLTHWEISTIHSKTYVLGLGGSSSPYENLLKNIEDKVISGTTSTVTKMDLTDGLVDESSGTIDEVLNKNGYPSTEYFFGAFALQGPLFNLQNTSMNPTFPWTSDVVLHNTSYPTSLPAYVQFLGMIRVWAKQNRTDIFIDASVGVHETELVQGLPSTVNVMSTLLILLPFAFFGSRMIMDLVEQRRSGLLQVMYASTLQPFAFWMGNFMYDMICFISLSFAGTVMYAFSTMERVIPGDDLLTLFGVLVLFGCSVISFSYILSNFFKSPLAAQSFANGLAILFGFALLIVSSVVRLLPNNPITMPFKEVNDAWAYVMRIFPLFNLGESIMNFAVSSDLSADGLLEVHLLPLAIPPILCTFWVMYDSTMRTNVQVFWRDRVRHVVENFIRRVVKTLSERHNGGSAPYTSTQRWNDASALLANDDPTVTAERSKGYTADGLFVRELWKRHHGVYAVQNISINIEGESLAVIGINGCGKSTLLRCVSGDLLPSFGSIFVNGYCSTLGHGSKLNAKGFLGYSAESLVLQNSSITPYLFLNIMADMRMIQRGSMRKSHITCLLRTLGIEAFMNVSIWALSASVQRRVSLAAALVGYPPVLLLDNITGDLDPLARRQVWAALKSSPPGTTTMFSTLSLDDVEMLADRLVLLDEGTMKFVGSPVEWRRRHKVGFFISIDVTPLSDSATTSHIHHAEERDLLCNFFSAHWEGSVLVDSLPFHYTFHIPLSNRHIGDRLNAPSDLLEIASVNIEQILATLLRGRSDGWKVDESNTSEAVNNNLLSSITISESTIQHAALESFAKSVAFQKAARSINDRNFYVSPRDYSSLATL